MSLPRILCINYRCLMGTVTTKSCIVKPPAAVSIKALLLDIYLAITIFQASLRKNGRGKGGLCLSKLRLTQTKVQCVGQRASPNEHSVGAAENNTS